MGKKVAAADGNGSNGNGGKLTEAKCALAKPTQLAGRTQRLADGKGLSLQVTAKGVKGWYLVYQGKREFLGAYPEMSLAQARTKRDAARKRIAPPLGIDRARQESGEAQREALRFLQWYGISTIASMYY